MKINSAFYNSLMSPMNAYWAGSGIHVGPRYSRIYLCSGELPTEEAFNAAWTQFATKDYPSKVPIVSMLNKLQSNILYYFSPVDTPRYDAGKAGTRIFNFSSLPEVVISASGVLSYIIIAFTDDNSTAYFMYRLSVGTIGSGADLEMQDTNLIAGKVFKLNDIEFNIEYGVN